MVKSESSIFTKVLFQLFPLSQYIQICLLAAKSNDDLTHDQNSQSYDIETNLPQEDTKWKQKMWSWKPGSYLIQVKYVTV